MLTLLIADDEVLERCALRQFAEEIPGVSVVAEAANGLEMVRQAAETTPDLALVDIRMPGKNGLDAIQEMRRVSPGTRCIIVTAYQDFQYAQHALRLGAVDYILKPAPREVVQQVITHAAARKEQEEEQAKALVESRISTSLPLIQTALVLDLISGAEPDLPELEAHAALVGMAQMPTVAMAISPDRPPVPSWQTSVQRDFVAWQVQGAVNSVLQSLPGCLAIPMGGGELAVVVSPPKDELVDLLSLAQQMKAACAKATQGTFTVGIGRRAAHPLELHRSYQEALSAVQYSKLILGCDRVIHIDEVPPDGPADNPALRDLERDAADRLRWGDKQGTQSAVQRLLAAYLDPNGAAPETFRLRMTELVVVLSRAAMDGGADPQRASAVTTESLWRLLQCQSVEECRRCLEETADRLLGLVVQRFTGSAEQMVHRALEYVRQHYAEPISVAEIASQFYVNPSHFCRSFKRVTGSTFIEYLTRVRLGRARELLATTDESVASIAREVGFQDANYFSRVFARHFQCPPGEFRRRLNEESAV